MEIFKKVILGISIFVAAIIFFIAVILGYFNLPVSNQNHSAALGVTFSNKYAASIGVDWKANFIAMLDDLKIRKIRIPVYWDAVEAKKDKFDFSDVDWQLNEAGKRNAEIILAMGQKTPRWPECNVPDWAKNDDQVRKDNLLKYIETTVERYKNNPAVKYWQVENEPFLNFGICPAPDADLLDSEIAVVRKLDPTRQIIVSDSGELSFWIQAAKRADIFGTTMYRTIWKKGIGYYEYPIGPKFFQFKSWIIKLFAHQNQDIVIELQAEPWIAGETTDNVLEEQFKSMNPDQLRANVEYAEEVGFPQIYLWGVEWWYWLKTDQDHPELWNTAKDLFGGRPDSVQPEKSIIKNDSPAAAKNIPDKIFTQVPFTSQAPFAKWDTYHEEACEEASLVMIKYFLDKKPLDPQIAEEQIQKMIKFEIKNYGDYKDSDAAQIVKLAHDFYGINNLKVVYDFQKEDIKKYLAEGKPIIVPAAGRLLGNPNFTPPGPPYHNLVLVGYDGNTIITNDPGTRKGENYKYDIGILYNAVHDFPGNLKDMPKGRKAMIVLG